MGVNTLGPLIYPDLSKSQIRPDDVTSRFQQTTADTETTVVWGKPGASPFQLNANVNVKVKDDDNIEMKRTYDTVRVKDPDNADNHVDMEVVTAYQLKNKIDGKRINITMDRVRPSDTVEILQQDQTRTSQAGGS
jgi:hypothetical protein